MDDKLYDERKAKILALLDDKTYLPAKTHEVAELMAVPHKEIPEFKLMVDRIVREGYAVITKKGKLMSAEKLSLVRGVFSGTARGFGFVAVEGMEQDIFIPPMFVNGAMHKDRVLARLSDGAAFGKKREGEIVAVLERGYSRIAGTYEQQRRGFGFVVPDNPRIGQDIFISEENSLGAVGGHKVLAEITKPPAEGRNAEGRITEIIGHKNDPGVDILSIILEHGLRTEFPAGVMRETAELPAEAAASEIAGREDFRNDLVITIDGEDAKDLDDAISLSLTDDGMYRLSVHIADVCNYVKEGTELDKEAFLRGTSVYLTDRVIPMLPHKLSNGICSLNPNLNRLTLSCIMDINNEGKVVRHRIVEGVICSRYRMTYTVVNELMTCETSAYREEYAEVLPMITLMNELREKLGKKRERRGAIDLGISESKIIVDGDGKPLDIVIRERNDATNLIEEFMLLCNETVAEEYFWAGLPFVYRVHEEPDGEKLERLSVVLNSFGYGFKGSTLHSKALQEILTRLEDRPEEGILSRLILRSLKQARYSASCDGHYGLAAKYYSHFTSPIRRYPDLQIHRIIKENLRGRLDADKIDGLNEALPQICRRCSETERSAAEVERETENLKKVEYMADKVGQGFPGIISGVTSRGIYVELENSVEGMVSADEMDDDYYSYDELGYRYIGRNTKRSYCLGDKVNILIAKADIGNKRLDFVLA